MDSISLGGGGREGVKPGELHGVNGRYTGRHSEHRQMNSMVCGLYSGRLLVKFFRLNSS